LIKPHVELVSTQELNIKVGDLGGEGANVDTKAFVEIKEIAIY
jgi:hypothetical protein